ncbi:MAG: YlxR family protein [Clostridia bacterium]|nr:YlxR family protein [Clostridia bacterium]
MAKKQQQPAPKKIPMRQCLGCNEHKPKIELVRILRTPEGEITLDLTGKRSGRGAYICKNPACLKKLRKNRRAEANLGVSIPEEVWDALEKQMAGEQ